MLKAMLTSKQAKFVASYQINPIATHAAINAGYSQKSATTIGCQLLSNPKIIAELDAWKAKKRAEITKDDFVDLALNDYKELNVTEPNKPRFLEIAGKSLGYIGNTQPIGASNDNRQVNITMLNLSDEQKKAPALIDLARSLMSAS